MISDILLALNVNDFTEKKGKLTYLSWANAWKELLKVYPKATYEVKKDEQGRCWFGDEKFGYMVYTSVTVEDVTHEMWLPVMNNYNKSILQPSTTDINKAVMRCLTKNLAMFGLGLYIYSGEDLPDDQPKEIKHSDLEALCKDAKYDVMKFVAAYNKNNDATIKEVKEIPLESVKLYHEWLLGKMK